ncbi:GNAT family N-acetyltransferase [Nocardiopsis valliformis]|uniref:GNAT family N-acetyltransferase n=1 Tax=Nocardiopsis valliformis TaxID=239974 RepID=UPI00037FE9C7|nr:GNAT family N-acetyltransferase [Nocardiopsis valliformis]
MTPHIRPARKGDLAQAHPLLRNDFPALVLTEEHMRWRFDHPRPDVEDSRLVAVVGDTLVGHVMSRLHTDEDGTRKGKSFYGALAEGHRNEELAARLLEASEAHLVEEGATVLRTDVAQEGVQVSGDLFRTTALQRGYQLVESHHVLGMDLSKLPDPPKAPAGAELRQWSEFADDPRPLYEIDKAADQDEPGETAEEFLPYEVWLNAVWHNPMSDLELSLVLLLDGVPVTISCYSSDHRTRMESAMTGTLPEYRGRGLAGYAKNMALHRAREQGFTHAYTGNHETNKPMLAINDRLGYTLVGSESTYVKRLEF